MSPLLCGYLIGIIYGLYFERSIALFYGVALIIAILIRLIISRKVDRYLKIIIKKQAVILFVLASIISNIHISYINQRYEDFYEGVDKIVEFTRSDNFRAYRKGKKL